MSDFDMALLRIEHLEAENERMRDLLSWLDRRGGLGLDAHDRIKAVLALEQNAQDKREPQ